MSEAEEYEEWRHTPRWEHDCEQCEFQMSATLQPRRLITEEVEDGFVTTKAPSTVYDFYICPSHQGHRFDNLIARYSDRPEDNSSYRPNPMNISVVSGLLFGLWCEYHDVRSAGVTHVTTASGEVIRWG